MSNKASDAFSDTVSTNVNRLMGMVRLVSITLVFVAALPIAVLLAFVPGRYHGARWAGWLLTLVARTFNRIFDLRFHCSDAPRLVRHHGLIFPNHSSYLDVVAMLTTSPVRWLAAIEVRNRPLIGQLAAAVDTVFVNRGSKGSRKEARDAVSRALRTSPYPPIVIFPEGKLDPGVSLYPFRHGAFELAIHNEVPFLPVALQYNRPEITTWFGGLRDEKLMSAIWRLACHRGRISVNVIVLDALHPTKADSPEMLAIVTQRVIEQALGFDPAPTS
jgi:1-acyl-sn-glycerol-3-phosphate acyltransferase